MIDNPFGKSEAIKHILKSSHGKEFKKPEEPKIEEIKDESEHAKIFREHGGLESNIPVHHHYWKIRP